MDERAIEYGEAQAGNVRIVYQVTGDGPPLVCCHAMGLDRSLWDDHHARFSENHRLITFDQRGSGDSDHPPYEAGDEEFYSADAFGEDLRSVLDDLEIERARVLGYSMGAVAALSFAVRWPARVEQLVLVSAMASRLPDEIIRRARIVEEVLEQKGLVETYGFYFSGSLFEGVSDSDEFQTNITRVLAKATSHGFRGCFHVTIDRPSMVDELHKIEAPTLILVGERDKPYMIEADLLADRIRDSKKVVVKNAGHALTLQEPDVFEREVLAFLS